MHIIRITLHNEDDYEPLHEAMTRRKLRKFIAAKDGKFYLLPDGTYFANQVVGDAEHVRKLAASAAEEVGHSDASIIVAKSDDVRFSNLEEFDLLAKLYDDVIALGAA